MTLPVSEVLTRFRPEWRRPLPASWRVARIKHLAQVFAGGTPDRENGQNWEDGTIPWLNSGEVNQWLVTEPSAYITEEGFRHSSAKWIPKGALVIALAGQGKTKGMVAQLGIETTCNQSMAAIVPHVAATSRFLLWWLHSNYETIRNLTGDELRDGLNLEIVGDIPCPCPSTDIQRAIADFLDAETARIDQLVDKRNQMLFLLRERFEAQLAMAMKRAAYRKIALRHVCITIRDGTHLPPARVATGYPLLSVRNIVDGELVFREDDSQVSESDFKILSSALEPREGDVVLAIVGATFGKVALVGRMSPFVLQRSVAVLRANRELIQPSFLRLALEAREFQTLLKSSVAFSAQPGIYLDALSGFHVPVPDLAAQSVLTTEIEAARQTVQHAADILRAQVNLLLERRQAIITAAVSGKNEVPT